MRMNIYVGQRLKLWLIASTLSLSRVKTTGIMLEASRWQTNFKLYRFIAYTGLYLGLQFQLKVNI
jgi:hypothetical protein